MICPDPTNIAMPAFGLGYIIGGAFVLFLWWASERGRSKDRHD